MTGQLRKERKCNVTSYGVPQEARVSQSALLLASRFALVRKVQETIRALGCETVLADRSGTALGQRA